ncbi:calcium-binding protein, partial [Phaeovulum sp.]|uniref:calcium-binding protein n=1 Tax=Phaeovulum sp. TaxID=2934796 RepID=UPI003565C019
QYAIDRQTASVEINPDTGLVFENLAEQNQYDDAKYYLWHGDLQTYPSGMNDRPEEFAQKLRDSLPLVNTLRLPFNENSFNADGSLHEQYERFLTAAAAEGFEIVFVYMGGTEQRLGSDGDMDASAIYSGLEANLGTVEGAWTSLLDWLDANSSVQAATTGYELISEPASYQRGADLAAADPDLANSFFALYAENIAALSDLVQARADGNILVGGWGYSAQFDILDQTLVDGVSVLDLIRASVGEDLVWSAHLYPGWLGTGSVADADGVKEILSAVYASVLGDNLLVTETNALGGAVDNYIYEEGSAYHNAAYLMARAYDWFADNGVGAAWFPAGIQTPSTLVNAINRGAVRFPNPDSTAHAMNLYSLDETPAEYDGAASLEVVVPARLFYSDYTASGVDSAYYTGLLTFSFGFGGNDLLLGDDINDADPRWAVANDLMYGGTGDDTLFGGAGEDYLFGQQGNDLLVAASGTNFLFGGTGNDVLIGGTDFDQMEGGDGQDHFDVSAGGNDIIIDFAPELGETIKLGAEFADFNALMQRVSAVDADLDGTVDDTQILRADGSTITILNLMPTDIAPGDFLLETAGILDGTVGNDLINALFADAQGDQIGDGDDLIYLGGGDDTLYDGLGNDTIYGGTGNDQIFGSKGQNLIFGGHGNDTISTGQHSSQLFGGEGDDVLRAQFRANAHHLLNGGNGADTFEFVGTQFDGTSHSVIEDFTLGTDRLVINGQEIDLAAAAPLGITISEIEGSTVLSLGPATDITLRDVLRPLANGQVDGTLQDDKIDQSYADRGAESATDADDLIHGWAGNDNILSGRGNDTIYGDSGDDVINGYKGNNLIYGGEGNDTLITGDRSSTLNGGAGDDWLIAYFNKNSNHVLTGGEGADTFDFTAPALDRRADATIVDFEFEQDTLRIDGVNIDLANLPAGYTLVEDNGNLVLHLGDDDTITLLNGTMTLPNGAVDGTMGSDNIRVGYADRGGETASDQGSLIHGWAGNDTIIAGRGNDTVYGGSGDDVINGYKGSNLLYGGDGNDSLTTGDQTSTLDGGAGDDWLYAYISKNTAHVLTGGSGTDTFEFTATRAGRSSHSVITDFEVGVDHLIFAGKQIDLGALPAGLTLSDVEGALTLHLTANDTITFQGITTLDLV